MTHLSQFTAANLKGIVYTFGGLIGNELDCGGGHHEGQAQFLTASRHTMSYLYKPNQIAFGIIK